MSNDPKPSTRDIAAVYFREPVIIGAHGYDEWLATAMAKTSQHTTSVEIDWQRQVLVISYKSKVMESWTVVPLTNVKSITQVARKS